MNQTVLAPWALSVGIAVGVWLFAWLTGRVLLRRLARVLRRTPTELDDLLLAAIAPRVPFLAALLGIAIGSQQAPLGEAARGVVSKALGAGAIFTLTLAAAAFLEALVRSKSSRATEALPATTLTQNLMRIVVMGIGLLVVAGQLGIAITPILTALGVGSLAVALALQPTLANLFAGVHISLARKIRVGEYVELENGGRGYVADIGWRSTQIRELQNNLIIVPNGRLAEIVVKNYTLPETEQAALVQVGVGYGSNLQHVESVTLEVARDTMREVPGAVADAQPLVRFHTFGESSVNFTVVLRVREFVDQYLVAHEFIRRLHERYARDGIEIPFPQRVLHIASAPVGEDRTAASPRGA